MMEPYLSSDLDTDRCLDFNTHNNSKDKDGGDGKSLSISVSLEGLGKLVTNADGFLTDVQQEGMLGSAIVRACNEIADAMTDLANDIEREQQREQQQSKNGDMAQACLEDIQQFQQDQQHLTLRQEKTDNSMMFHGNDPFNTDAMVISEQDMKLALIGAKDLLRDVATSLKSLEQRDADEIADVALTLARLFIWSLQDAMRQMGSISNTTNDRSFSDRIEILDDGSTNKARQTDNEEGKSYNPSRASNNPHRVRCLWPPLGPAVMNACQWGQTQAVKRPLLAVALGLTLWPAAVCTSFLAVPVVVGDTIVQHIYQSCQEGPLISTVERGAAQLVQATKLSLLCSGLVARQSWRVATRQVERHGGLDKLAQHIGGVMIDRAMHPVETAGMAWDGVVMGIGAIGDAIHFAQNNMEREMEKQQVSSMS